MRDDFFRRLDRHFADMLVRLDSLFEDTETPSVISSRSGITWKVKDDNYVLTLDVPGVRREDIQVTVPEEGRLAIKGKRGQDTFERVYKLPAEADEKKVSAQLADGVLTITLGKAKPQTPATRTIPVT